MAARRILITGAANRLGVALAEVLLADAEVELVVAVDTRPPQLPAGARAVHVDVDLRSPDLARAVAPYAPDAIVHNDVLQFAEPGRSAQALHEINVVGTLQLLAAADALPSLRTLVVRSSAAIYGSEPNAPGFFAEDMARRFPLRSRWQRDVAELETLVEGHARRHPHLAVAILRPQPLVGATLDTPIMRLFRAPVVPTWMGFDPRVQVVHGDDVVAAMAAALRARVRGPVNVAGEGTVALSRVLRRLGRRPLPVPPPAFGATVRLLGLGSLGPDVERYLRYGRGVDTGRMRRELGFVPRHTTLQAIEATASALGGGAGAGRGVPAGATA